MKCLQASLYNSKKRTRYLSLRGPALEKLPPALVQHVPPGEVTVQVLPLEVGSARVVRVPPADTLGRPLEAVRVHAGHEVDVGCIQ